MMLRLGDNPTDEELRVMVAEVDQVGIDLIKFVRFSLSFHDSSLTG